MVAQGNPVKNSKSNKEVPARYFRAMKVSSHHAHNNTILIYRSGGRRFSFHRSRTHKTHVLLVPKGKALQGKPEGVFLAFLLQRTLLSRF